MKGKISEEVWTAIRAEWEAGLKSGNQLAKDYDISEGAIRKRRDTDAKRGKPWEVIPEVHQRAQEAAKARALAAAAKAHREAEQRRLEQEVREQHEAVRTERAELRTELALIRSSEDVRAAVIEEAVEQAVDAIGAATEAHARRLQRVAQTLEVYHNLVTDILEGDKEKAQAAADRILAGRNDSVATSVQTLVRGYESLQRQTRTMFGIQAPAQRLELTGAGGGPVEHQTRSLVGHLDLSSMPTEQLAALVALNSAIEQSTGRPPVPMPPGGPAPLEDVAEEVPA